LPSRSVTGAFTNGDISLSYLLERPPGRGPFPAIVVGHGSGEVRKEAFQFIASNMLARGFAVLRYDKRTLRYGAKMATPVLLDDEVLQDAVSAVNLLRSRPEVDRDRIFVIGHSLGALLAPEIAGRASPVAGAVLLAPPGRPPWDIVLAQMRYLEAPQEEMAEAERKAALLKAGKLGTEKFFGVEQAYWQDWAARDGIGMARKLGRPILILRGDRDFQVGEEDLAVWRNGLAGTPKVEIATLPGLSHLFIRGEGKPRMAEYDIPGHVDPAVIERLRSFVVPPAPAR
jgi:hypothetical protein